MSLHVYFSPKFRYCNSHLNMYSNAAQKASQQLDGSKEKPVKSQRSNNTATSVDSAALADIKMSLQDRLKSKFNIHQRKESKSRPSEDDPYAFPDGDPEPMKKNSSGITKTSQSINDTVSAIVANCLNNHLSYSSSSSCSASTNSSICVTSNIINNTVPDSNTTTSTQNTALTPIAKLYPELAEKLHLPVMAENWSRSEATATTTVTSAVKKPSPAGKGGRGSSAKSSRTMNKLQTKIAQNRIKDKRNQSNNTSGGSSQSSPDRKPPTPVTSTVHTSLPAELTRQTSSSYCSTVTTAASSNTVTTSSNCSPLQHTGFMSPLPSLDPGLWGLHLQQQHTLTTVGSSGSTSGIPLLSIPSCPPHNSLTSLTSCLSSGSVTSTSSAHTPLPLVEPQQQQQLELSPHLQQQQLTPTVSAPFINTYSGHEATKAQIPTPSPLPYPPTLALPVQPSAVATPSLPSPYSTSALPPPPPYPGSPKQKQQQQQIEPTPSVSTPTAITLKQPASQQQQPKPKVRKAKRAKPAAKSLSGGEVVSSTAVAIEAKNSSAHTSLQCVKVQKVNSILTEKEARQKLKRHSAVRVYAYHANRRTNTGHLLPMGMCYFVIISVLG